MSDDDEKSRPRTVYVRYVYIPYISEIDTRAQTFSLRVDYDLYWEASAKEVATWDKLVKEKAEKSYDPIDFVPALVLQNAINIDTNELQMQETGGSFVVKEDAALFGPGRKMNFARFEVRGVFQQRFSTLNFPFDCQELNIHMCLKFQTVDRTIMKACTDFKTKKPMNVFQVLQEFNSIQDWDIVNDQCSGRCHGDDGWTWCSVRIVVRRRPWAIVWKFFLLISFLCWCGVAAIGMEDRGDKMGFMVTLLLTVVAIQYTLNEYLPMGSSPSFADYLMISSFVFTAGLTIEGAYQKDDENGDLVKDDTVEWIAVIVCIVLHVFFAAWAGYACILLKAPHNAHQWRTKVDEVTKKTVKYLEKPETVKAIILDDNK